MKPLERYGTAIRGSPCRLDRGHLAVASSKVLPDGALATAKVGQARPPTIEVEM
jgi:hypothetical protein